MLCERYNTLVTLVCFHSQLAPRGHGITRLPVMSNYPCRLPCSSITMHCAENVVAPAVFFHTCIRIFHTEMNLEKLAEFSGRIGIKKMKLVKTFNVFPPWVLKTHCFSRASRASCCVTRASISCRQCFLRSMFGWRTIFEMSTEFLIFCKKIEGKRKFSLKDIEDRNIRVVVSDLKLLSDKNWALEVT